MRRCCGILGRVSRRGSSELTIFRAFGGYLRRCALLLVLLRDSTYRIGSALDSLLRSFAHVSALHCYACCSLLGLMFSSCCRSLPLLYLTLSITCARVLVTTHLIPHVSVSLHLAASSPVKTASDTLRVVYIYMNCSMTTTYLSTNRTCLPQQEGQHAALKIERSS